MFCWINFSLHAWMILLVLLIWILIDFSMFILNFAIQLISLVWLFDYGYDSIESLMILFMQLMFGSVCSISINKFLSNRSVLRFGAYNLLNGFKLTIWLFAEHKSFHTYVYVLQKLCIQIGNSLDGNYSAVI